MLILDEATASVDAATDEMISGTIRSQFSDSTLLVIAREYYVLAPVQPTTGAY